MLYVCMHVCKYGIEFSPWRKWEERDPKLVSHYVKSIELGGHYDLRLSVLQNSYYQISTLGYRSISQAIEPALGCVLPLTISTLNPMLKFYYLVNIELDPPVPLNPESCWARCQGSAGAVGRVWRAWYCAHGPDPDVRRHYAHVCWSFRLHRMVPPRFYQG